MLGIVYVLGRMIPELWRGGTMEKEEEDGGKRWRKEGDEEA